MRRIPYLSAILIITVSASAFGQASAGCGEVGVCGGSRGTSGTKTGNGTTANSSRNARAAAAMQSIQNTQRTNQQILQNGANALINVLTSGQGNNGNAGSNPSVPNDSTTGSADSSSGGYIAPEPVYTWEPAAQPSTASAVSALLDSDQPASSSTAAAVSALLGDGTQPDTAQPSTGGTTTANAVANLLDSSKVSDSASAFSLPTPADPQIDAVFQESADQPDQGQSRSMTQVLQSAEQQVTDTLTGLVSSGKSLLSTLSNDPTVYWAINQGWNGTTAPLPTASDTPEMPASTPEEAANLVQGQAIVGFGDLMEGMAEGPVGFAKGLYTYGSKMVNQMGADLGFADANIVSSDAGNSN